MSLLSEHHHRRSLWNPPRILPLGTAWHRQWTLAPSRCFKLLPYLALPASQLSLRNGAGIHRTLSTSCRLQSRLRRRKFPHLFYKTEQEVERAQRAFPALREENTNARYRRVPNIVLDYGARCGRSSTSEHTRAKGQSTIHSHSENDVRSLQRPQHIIPKGLESERLVPLMQCNTDHEATEQAIKSSGASGSSPELCYTPSDALIYSLGSLSPLYITFRNFPNKIDLSHTNPLDMARDGRYDVRRKHRASAVKDGAGPYFPKVRPSLQRLLAEYLRSCWPQNPDGGHVSREPEERLLDEQALNSIFSPENVAILHNQGYELEDLISWAWILTAKSTDRAVWRLMALTADLNRSVNRRRMVPAFVYLFTLRRDKWSARALRTMIIHGWDRLKGRFDSRQELHDTPRTIFEARACMSKQTLVIMVVRLLRLARRVWPEASISIVTMLTEHERASSVALSKPQPIAQLTFLYNTVLSLLALPASTYPFLSITAQQQAQFNIIRLMNEFDPPLAIDREGYRAVTRIQLAHKKSIQERDWASLKAKSWPPWKEEKLGIDADKDARYGMSRAKQIIKQMEEAGYSVLDWEATAEILAGWDTDGSPTIQKRSLHSRPVMSRQRPREEKSSDVMPKVGPWAARIQVTRTVDEAWACFLAYRDELNRTDLPSESQAVYHSMAEKLIFEERRSSGVKKAGTPNDTSTSDKGLPLAGDGKEVFERPSPQEAIFVRSSPPSLDTFINMIPRNKISISPRFLALLLSHARSFRMGIHHLNSSTLPKAVVDCILCGDPASIDNPVNQELMPPYLFAAVIDFLSKFAQLTSHKGLPIVHLSTRRIAGPTSPRINPLVQAYRLVSTYKPYHRPPWNSLLAALARNGVSLETFAKRVDDRVQGILAWKAILSLVEQMHRTGLSPDLAGFYHICAGYEKAIIASEALVDSPDFGYVRQYLDGRPKQFLDDGLSYIKDLFTHIVSEQSDDLIDISAGSGNPTVDYLLPRLLEIPGPAQIHAFIRILGLCKDHQGLIETVEWMARFAPELQARADELMNGKRMLRRCLTAARVFLDPSWLFPGENLDCYESSDGTTCRGNSEDISNATHPRSVHTAQEDLAQTYAPRLHRIIDENPNWGGWPTEAEVDAYVGRNSVNTP